MQNIALIDVRNLKIRLFGESSFLHQLEHLRKFRLIERAAAHLPFAKRRKATKNRLPSKKCSLALFG